MIKIIFVCTGNICRSPIAEGIMKNRFQQDNRSDYSVTSMGTHGLDGNSASQYAIEVCAENGINIADHIARALVPDELENSTHVFVMEPIHIDYIFTFFPKIKHKTYLLASWPDRKTKKLAIKDPVGGSISVFRKTFTELSIHIDRVYPKIIGDLILHTPG
jgi:protein-tyrosine-phosphatase